MRRNHLYDERKSMIKDRKPFQDWLLKYGNTPKSKEGKIEAIKEALLALRRAETPIEH